MPCPFCDHEVPAGSVGCPGCGRDSRLRRRPCPSCRAWTPATEPACCRCGAKFKSELRWKIPLIIAIFVVAIILSVVIQIWSQ